MNKHIIFDFGAVLIDWNSDVVYGSYFKDTEAMQRFYRETNIHTLNKEFDRGLPFDIGLKQLAMQFPHYHEPIKLWKTAWQKMIVGVIDGSVDILHALHAKGYPLYGLTNWSAETFPYVYYQYDFFQCFKDIVVSGRENTIKPETAIFEIILKRNNLDPRQCVFIDDVAANVTAAETLGIKGIRFESPEKLLQELRAIDITI